MQPMTPVSPADPSSVKKLPVYVLETMDEVKKSWAFMSADDVISNTAHHSSTHFLLLFPYWTAVHSDAIKKHSIVYIQKSKIQWI
jgi:hypothetical protein